MSGFGVLISIFDFSVLFPAPKISSSSSSSRKDIGLAFCTGFCFTVAKRSSPWLSKIDDVWSFFEAVMASAFAFLWLSLAGFVLCFEEGGGFVKDAVAKRSSESNRSSSVSRSFFGLTASSGILAAAGVATGIVSAEGRGETGFKGGSEEAMSDFSYWLSSTASSDCCAARCLAALVWGRRRPAPLARLWRPKKDINCVSRNTAEKHSCLTYLVCTLKSVDLNWRVEAHATLTGGLMIRDGINRPSSCRKRRGCQSRDCSDSSRNPWNSTWQKAGGVDS